MTEDDIGVAVDHFRIRADPDDDQVCPSIEVKLWALGDNAAIWVDDRIPIDQYEDCSDPTAGVVYDPYNAYGFSKKCEARRSFSER